MRAVTLTLLLPLLALAGCGRGNDSDNLFRFEIDFLAEDVEDLMTIVFQASENAFVGDAPDADDVTQEAEASNQFTAGYRLEAAQRPGLGFGSGIASRRVEEDGVPHPNPESFSPSQSSALVIVIEYELRYDGDAPQSGRDTDVDLTIEIEATRMPDDTFLVEYRVDGDVDLGATFTTIVTDFRAPGRPRDGIEPLFGDGAGFIDDPDVFDVFDLDIDYRIDGFDAEGEVGCCAFFEEFFRYSRVT